jgi:hypothetical protein
LVYPSNRLHCSLAGIRTNSQGGWRRTDDKHPLPPFQSCLAFHCLVHRSHHNTCEETPNLSDSSENGCPFRNLRRFTVGSKSVSSCVPTLLPYPLTHPPTPCQDRHLLKGEEKVGNLLPTPHNIYTPTIQTRLNRSLEKSHRTERLVGFTRRGTHG